MSTRPLIEPPDHLGGVSPDIVGAGMERSRSGHDPGQPLGLARGIDEDRTAERAQSLDSKEHAELLVDLPVIVGIGMDDAEVGVEDQLRNPRAPRCLDQRLPTSPPASASEPCRFLPRSSIAI